MNIERGLHVFAFCIASVFIAVPNAHAGRGIDLKTGQAVWDAAVSGKTTRIGTGAGAMKVIGPAGSTTAGANGAAKVSGSGPAPVGGKSVPVGITAEVAKEAIVGGVIGAVTGGVGGAVVGAAIPLTMAYLNDSGVRVNPDTGALEMQDNSICTIPPCYEFQPPGASRWFKTNIDAANWLAEDQNKVSSYWLQNPTVTGPTQPGATFQRYNANTTHTGPTSYVGTVYYPFNTRPAAPASPTWYPVTSQEAKDALYKKTPDPGIVDELSKYGNITWPLGNVQLSGPASIPGEKSVKKNPDGSTTVTTTKTEYTYEGDKVKEGNKITTATTTKADGSTETTEETETPSDQEDAPKQDAPKEDPPIDTPLPEVPKLYERKYPDGIVGIWNQKRQQLNQTQLFQLPQQLMPTGIGGGSCPSFKVPLDFAAFGDYGQGDVSPPCWVWDVAKVIVLIGAAILARALIFGG